MYKLEFILKQHTPLIHFQHEQEGATLRATEVKPKLDRYIIKNILHDDYDKCKEYLTGYNYLKPNDCLEKFQKGYRALNYKLRIDVIKSFDPKIINGIELIERPKKDKNDNIIIKKNKIDSFQFPPFFGNMGDESDKIKKFSIYDNVTITFISSAFNLNEILTPETLYKFLSSTNFGMRQSKGFGSFYVYEKIPDIKYHFSIDCTKPEFDSFKINKADYEWYSPYNDSEYYKIKKLFSTINLFYSALRSGINTSNFGHLYFKSLMFMYAKHLTPPQQWDKRTLREIFYSDHPTYTSIKTNRTDKSGTVNYNSGKKSKLLFRDLLGLSSEQDWMRYGPENIDINGNVSYGADKLIKKNTEIDRFKSPILFKPIRRENSDIFDVYITTEKIPEFYFNQKFEIISKKWTRKTETMKIPDKSIFSIDNYLDFCFKEIFKTDKDIINHIGNDNKNESKLLIKIFSELRNC